MFQILRDHSKAYARALESIESSQKQCGLWTKNCEQTFYPSKNPWRGTGVHLSQSTCVLWPVRRRLTTIPGVFCGDPMRIWGSRAVFAHHPYTTMSAFLAVSLACSQQSQWEGI